MACTSLSDGRQQRVRRPSNNGCDGRQQRCRRPPDDERYVINDNARRNQCTARTAESCKLHETKEEPARPGTLCKPWPCTGNHARYKTKKRRKGNAIVLSPQACYFTTLFYINRCVSVLFGHYKSHFGSFLFEQCHQRPALVGHTIVENGVFQGCFQLAHLARRP